MCGRFTLFQPPEVLAEVFQLAKVPSWEPQYNIAPSQSVLTVLTSARIGNQRRSQLLRWGLIPSWAKDPTIGARLINARAETVSEKPSFRSAFRQRRCLVIADGFYEWQRQEGKKQPFYFRLQNGEPFAFAGLWERWEAPEGETIESCTILTTTASQLLYPIHDRMPVILNPKDYDLWLDPVQKSEPLQQLLRPYSEVITAYPVSTKVNKPTNNGSDCITKLVEVPVAS